MKATCVLLLASVVCAHAQIDLAGEWSPRFHEDQPERLPGPDIGDYLGLPINDAARMRGETWNPSILQLPEHQCKPHPSDYGPRGPADLRIWKEVDLKTQQTVAWRTHISWQAPERTIYMDGRPHPPEYAAHTWQGFSTGRWEGDVLVVTTTHLKTGWIRRNGIPRSDHATVTEHFIRHGDHLTLVTYIDDPAYLTEPLVRSTDFVANPRQQIEPYPCEIVELTRVTGDVPHFLPGTNPYLKEFTDAHPVPTAAERGGPETMFPGYRAGANNTPHPAVTAPAPKPESPEIKVLPVTDRVYMLVGGGGNSALQIGPEGALIVDSKLAANAQALVAAVRGLTREPIRFILNTSDDLDKTGGNAVLSQAGSTITGGNFAPADVGWGATIVAQDKVAEYMSKRDLPPDSIPTNSYSVGKEIYFNGEAIRMYHPPSAHTNGDSIIFFRKSDVVVTGDIFTPDRYPVIDVKRGGSINGVVSALNQIIDITIPAEKEEGGTMVVPGHGRLSDEADVVEYRDMVTILRDRIRDAVKKGMTLDQVKAARLTRDYDPLYGPPDAFVESAYTSLKEAK